MYVHLKGMVFAIEPQCINFPFCKVNNFGPHFMTRVLWQVYSVSGQENGLSFLEVSPLLPCRTLALSYHIKVLLLWQRGPWPPCSHQGQGALTMRKEEKANILDMIGEMTHINKMTWKKDRKYQLFAKDMEQPELHILLEGVQTGTATLGGWQNLPKLNVHMASYEPLFPLLAKRPTERRVDVQQKTLIRIFTAVWCVTAENYKPPKCPSTVE